MATKVSPPPIAAEVTDYTWKTWFQSVWTAIRNIWYITSDGLYNGIGEFSDLIQPEATLHVRVPQYSTTDATFIVERDDETFYPKVIIRRSRGVNSARASTQAGDLLGSIDFSGYYSAGGNWPVGASIRTQAEANTTGSFTTQSSLLTYTSDTIGPRISMSVNSGGDVTFGKDLSLTNPAIQNTNYNQMWLGPHAGILFPKSSGSADLHITSNAMFYGNSWKYLMNGAVSVIRFSTNANGTVDILQESSGTGGTAIPSGMAVTPTLRVSKDGGVSIQSSPASVPLASMSSLWVGPNQYICGDRSLTAGAGLTLAQNLFLNASSQWQYISTDSAELYQQFAKKHIFYLANAGTAGTNAALQGIFAVTVDGIGVFNASPSYPIDVTHATLPARITNAWVGRMTDSPSYWMLGNTSLAATSANYAIAQGASGDTLINAPSGQVITFRNANTSYGTLGPTGFSMTTSGQITTLIAKDFGSNGANIKFDNGTDGGLLTYAGYIRQIASNLEIINSVYSTIRIQFPTGVAAVGIQPFTDNSLSCGATGHRWSTVWAANGTIQTSDGRLKTNVADSALGLSFIEKLRPVSYKWKVGSNIVEDLPPKKDKNGKDILSTDNHRVVPVAGKRTHWGLIAQEVKTAIDAAGVEDFAGWVQDDLSDPNSAQSLNYGEFIAPMIKAIQELSARVKSLEAQLAAK